MSASGRNFGSYDNRRNQYNNDLPRRGIGSNNFGRNSFGGYENGGSSISPWLNQGSSGIVNQQDLLSTVSSLAADPQRSIALACNLINLATQVQNNPIDRPTVKPPSLLSMGPPQSRRGLNSGRMEENYGHYRDRSEVDMRDKMVARSHMLRGGVVHDRGLGYGRSQGVPDRYQGPVGNRSHSYNKRGQDNLAMRTSSATIEGKLQGRRNGMSKDGKSGVNKNSLANAGPKKEKEETKKSDQVSKFAKVLPALLYCHVCKKHMWDDTSFEKHIAGRFHLAMMEDLTKSYELRTAILRHDCKTAELVRAHDLQRARSSGKGVKVAENYCPMCDIKFLGTVPSHRRMDTHQNLKRFLHPGCTICNKECASRMEWDEHRLSAPHLEKLSEYRKITRPEASTDEFDVLDFIEDIHDEMEHPAIELKIFGCAKLDNENEEAKDKEADMNGEKFLQKVTEGFLCRACRRFILNEEDCKAHCLSVKHLYSVQKLKKVQESVGLKPAVKHQEKTEENGNEIKTEAYDSDGDASSDASGTSCKRMKLVDISLGEEDGEDNVGNCDEILSDLEEIDTEQVKEDVEHPEENMDVN